MNERSPMAGRVVLIAGATSASGVATASALLLAGARVIAVGSNPERLAAFRSQVPGAVTELCDLADAAAVAALADRVHAALGPVDGLAQLVGGWRGGDGIAGQSDADWAFLERAFTALRNTSRTFYDDLVASTAGRLAIVSSSVVENPAASDANYASAKAAAETWMRAVGQGFAGAGDSAAATIFVVAALAGLEDLLAARVVGLWTEEPASLNGARIPLP